MRLVIETDRRVLVLAGDDPGRVVFEEPSHRVKMERRGRWTVLEAGGRRVRLRRVGAVGGRSRGAT
ncbi:MAG: hypothetical protein Tsb0013_24580 [Phycisphaerales bacterium]